jgi:hypothetical protein
MNTNIPQIEGDTLSPAYDLMKSYSKTLKEVKGLSCEIGVRSGMGSKSMMEGFVENNDRRPHICVDPFGDIIMLNDRFYNGAIRCGFDNGWKCNTAIALYDWCKTNKVNLIFLPLEDVEFFQRFNDGIPIYETEKRIVNKYCYVHVDGPHTYNAAKNSCEFFLNKMDTGSIIAFDNCDHYDQNKIENEFLTNNGFEFVVEYDECHKRFYKKIK